MKGNAYITGNYIDWIVDLSLGAWMYQQVLAYMLFPQKNNSEWI